MHQASSGRFLLTSPCQGLAKRQTARPPSSVSRYEKPNSSKVSSDFGGARMPSRGPLSRHASAAASCIGTRSPGPQPLWRTVDLLDYAVILSLLRRESVGASFVHSRTACRCMWLPATVYNPNRRAHPSPWRPSLTVEQPAYSLLTGSKLSAGSMHHCAPASYQVIN